MDNGHYLDDKKGAIAWMTHNRVTPNLLMIVLIAGGLFFASKIKQEVFPEFDQDRVNVSVPYPGSSPEDRSTDREIRPGERPPVPLPELPGSGGAR